MLTAARSLENKHVVFHIKGILDGNTDFPSLIGEPPGQMILDFGGITHVNSSIVRLWLHYFQELQAKGVQFAFRACPAVLTEYFNMLPGFACGGEILSVIAPFFCENCKNDEEIPVETPNRPQAEIAIQNHRCRVCSGGLQLDEEPDSFFAFLSP